MKPLMKVLMLVPFAFLAAVPAYADHNSGRLEDRLARQQERIDAGVDSGALTHREARTLNREQSKLRKLAHRMGKDGKITSKEERKLTSRLDQASKRIRDYKHNANYRVVKTERCFNSRAHWRNSSGHHWSRELNIAPRYSIGDEVH